MVLQYFYPYKMLFTKLDVMLERVRVEQLTIPLIFPLIFQRDRWLVLALCPNRSCEVICLMSLGELIVTVSLQKGWVLWVVATPGPKSFCCINN